LKEAGSAAGFELGSDYPRIPRQIRPGGSPAARGRRSAAHRLKRSKQDLVTSLVAGLGDPETLRRVTVETTNDGLTVGHAEFRPFDPPDVLTTASSPSGCRSRSRRSPSWPGPASAPGPPARRWVALRARGRAGLARQSL